MTKPISLRPDLSGVRPTIFQAAAVYVRSHATGETLEQTARTLFKERAAPSPAMLGTPAWAGLLGHGVVGDLLQETTSISAAANVMGRGLKVSLAGITSLRIPGRTVDPTLAVHWMNEDQPVVFKAPPLVAGPTLKPKKIATLSAYTYEQAMSSNIEGFIKQAFVEAVGLALDQVMFSSAAEGAAPPGLLTSATTVPPSTASAGWALSSDIGGLVEALSMYGAGADPILVCAPHQFAALHTWFSEATKFYPVFGSQALSAGTIVAIERSSFVSAYDPQPEFSLATGATVQMDDSTPASDLLTQSPVKSMYQTDLIGLKTILRVAWGLRNPQHVAIVSGVTW